MQLKEALMLPHIETGTFGVCTGVRVCVCAGACLLNGTEPLKIQGSQRRPGEFTVMLRIDGDIALLPISLEYGAVFSLCCILMLPQPVGQHVPARLLREVQHRGRARPVLFVSRMHAVIIRAIH